jgi:signal transduction histidine kinase
MLTLSSQHAGGYSTDGSTGALALLAEVHHQISDLLREIPATTAPEVGQLGLLGAIRRYVSIEAGQAFDDVSWQVEPTVEEKCRHLPALIAEVMFYAVREVIRNAARYGRGADADSPLALTITATWDDDFKLIVEDNGVGLSSEPRSHSRSGHGLALHSTMMAVIGGALLVESSPGAYMRVTLVVSPGKITEMAGLKRF